MTRTPFEEAWYRLPTCLVGGSVDDAQSLDDVYHSVQIEIDLIEEGEVAYTAREAKSIRKYFTWLADFMA
jgi:hypothetical protein